MPTKSNGRSVGARKTAPRGRPVKKKVRRVIFKADQWYAGAAMSIGIAGRAKGARPAASAMFMQRVDESAD
jgi:hypothetical protein